MEIQLKTTTLFKVVVLDFVEHMLTSIHTTRWGGSVQNYQIKFRQ